MAVIRDLSDLLFDRSLLFVEADRQATSQGSYLGGKSPVIPRRGVRAAGPR